MPYLEFDGSWNKSNLTKYYVLLNHIYVNKIVYQKSYTNILPVFCLQNNRCEDFTTIENKFKRWFCTKKRGKPSF